MLKTFSGSKQTWGQATWTVSCLPGLCSVRRKWSVFIILFRSYESQEWRPGIRRSCRFEKGFLVPWISQGTGSLKIEHYKTYKIYLTLKFKKWAGLITGITFYCKRQTNFPSRLLGLKDCYDGSHSCLKVRKNEYVKAKMHKRKCWVEYRFSHWVFIVKNILWFKSKTSWGWAVPGWEKFKIS